MRRLIIARHGNTFEPSTPPRRIGSRTDIPLTTTGLAQAALLGMHFAERGILFSRALCGPLLRARQSAAIILHHQQVSSPTEIVDWLNEIDHGPDENQTESNVIARLGADTLKAWDVDGIAPQDWIVDAPQRIHCWTSFMSESREETCLLVTSNGAARFALAALNDVRAPADRKLATGAFGEICCHADGSTELLAWNVRPLLVN